MPHQPKSLYVNTHNTHIGESMPNMTLSIPSDLHSIVKQHNEINWSEIARRAMAVQAKKLQLMDKLVGKSQFTEKDIDELDHKIKAGLRKRLS